MEQKRILKVNFGNVNQKNINLFKTININTLPIEYSDFFYFKVIYQYLNHTKLAFYNDIVVGAYSARKQLYKQIPAFYIITLGVLQPYQKYGIGTQLIDQLLQQVKQDGTAKIIYLHLHVLNQKGMAFYKKCRFKIIERIDNYYLALQQPHCYLMTYDLQNEKQQ